MAYLKKIKLKFKAKDSEIEISNPENFIEKNIDLFVKQIIYLKPKFVIFRDIDLDEEWTTLFQLKEISQLVSNILKNINFIYVIDDDVYYSNYGQNLFDITFTTIPLVTTLNITYFINKFLATNNEKNNGGYELDKIIYGLENSNSEKPIYSSAPWLKYINTIQDLKGFLNYYYFQSALNKNWLISSDDNEPTYNRNKVVSVSNLSALLVIYKQKYLKDFDDFYYKMGNLYWFFKKFDTESQAVDNQKHEQKIPDEQQKILNNILDETKKCVSDSKKYYDCIMHLVSFII